MAAVNESWSPASTAARAASQTSAVASSAATSMLAQWCLTAWKVAMGRPNCTRTLAYAAACSVHSVAMPTASAAVMRRARSTRTRRPPGITSAGAPDSTTAVAAPRQVEVVRDLHHDATRSNVHDDGVVTRGEDEQMGEATAQDRRSRAGGLAVRHRDVRRQRDAAEDRAVGQPGQEARRQRTGRGRVDHRAGDHRRHERSGRDGAAELLGHHDELGQPEAGAALVLGEVEAEPAE